MNELAIILPVLDFLEAHPRLRALFARTIVASPAGRVLPFIHRGLLGMRAFDLHDIDDEKGEISFGGVREVIFGAGWLKLFHDEIAAAIGDEAKDQLLYRLATRGTTWEMQETLRDMRWVPAEFKQAIAQGRLLEAARTDPRMARFFRHITRAVSRLIITEGGWGNVIEYAFEQDPIRVVMDESMEAKMCGPSNRPICVITAGGIAGYLIGLTGQPFAASEVRCCAVATGPAHGDYCEFEVRQLRPNKADDVPS